jgi:hypothetical protein
MDNYSILEQNNTDVVNTNDSSIVERNIRGKIITVNRLKHYGFIKRFVSHVISHLQFVDTETMMFNNEIYLHEKHLLLVKHKNQNSWYQINAPLISKKVIKMFLELTQTKILNIIKLIEVLKL